MVDVTMAPDRWYYAAREVFEWMDETDPSVVEVIIKDAAALSRGAYVEGRADVQQIIVNAASVDIAGDPAATLDQALYNAHDDGFTEGLERAAVIADTCSGLDTPSQIATAIRRENRPR